MSQKRRLTKQSARLQKKEPLIRSCSDCAHAKLDPLFGDYKCLKHQHYLYDINLANHCGAYKEGKKDAIDPKSL